MQWSGGWIVRVNVHETRYNTQPRITNLPVSTICLSPSLPLFDHGSYMLVVVDVAGRLKYKEAHSQDKESDLESCR